MPQESFTYSSELPASASAAFDWHLRPGAFERLAPPWQRVQVLKRSGSIQAGGQVLVRVYSSPMPTTWLVEHHDFIPGKQFADRLMQGPFKAWRHQHRIEPVDEHTCKLTDHIEYALPMGGLGSALGGGMVKRELERTFAYRHQLLAADLKAQQAARDAGLGPLRIGLTGAHGLIGESLTDLLTTTGHTVIPITRAASRSAGHDIIIWDPRASSLDPAAFQKVDAVIHLAGESIMGRWNAAKKQRIRDSRVQGTSLLAKTLASLDSKPRAFICASAIGYFGDRGDESLTEQSPPGQGFLADVCRQWEDAAQPAADAGIRVAHARFGLVLHPQGGGLKQILPIFKLGLGGVLGSGDQFWSWVSLNDVTAILHQALYDDRLAGPINVVSPEPPTNRAFTKTLGRVLRRPTVFPVPRFAARAVIGPFADEGLLASQRVIPEKLTRANYRFRDPQLEPALRLMLGKAEQ